jgi:hypothetical protein
MPDPKDNAKLTGNTHQPDLDSADDEDAPAAEYTRSGARRGSGKGRSGSGDSKDKDAEAGNTAGTTRDSGERAT